MAIAAVERFHRRIEIRLGFLQLPFKSRVIQRASKGAAFRLEPNIPEYNRSASRDTA